MTGYIYINFVTNNSGNENYLCYPTKEVKYHHPDEITVNSFNFTYLGFVYQADGNWIHAVEVRMALARTRSGTMYHI